MPSTILEVPGKTSPPSVEGLSFFCFFSLLKDRKEGLIRKSSKTSGSSFLLLIEEKKQKKIKASGMPAKFQASNLYECTRKNFPALGRGPEFLLLLFFSQGKK